MFSKEEHTQTGDVACGGWVAAASNSCLALTAGSWQPWPRPLPRPLLRPRTAHSAWASPRGLVLLGGQHSPDTAELVPEAGAEPQLLFPLLYDTV